MNAARRIPLLPILATPVVAFGFAISIGCNNVNVRGDGFSESFTESARVKRPEEQSAKPFGFSTKAREIEADFGVK
ncbi:MAG: hypothetical protein QM775_14990 [Pirellulales bacterium]